MTDAKKLSDLESELKKGGFEVLTAVADATKDAEVKTAFDHFKAWGTIEVLEVFLLTLKLLAF
jgi:hypothetical protein